jgi:hypothetical protein
VLQSGRDLTLKAGRDVNIVPTQVSNSVVLDSRHTNSDITQLDSSITAGDEAYLGASNNLDIPACPAAVRQWMQSPEQHGTLWFCFVRMPPGD